jgi:Flp pilus assembly protein TadD
MVSMSARWRVLVAAATLLVVPSLLAGCTTYRAARLYGRGTQALEQGDTARAIDALEQAAVLAPHASEIHNHLGLAYRSAGRHREARAAFEFAVELDCDNHAAASNLRAAREAEEEVP